MDQDRDMVPPSMKEYISLMRWLAMTSNDGVVLEDMQKEVAIV